MADGVEVKKAIRGFVWDASRHQVGSDHPIGVGGAFEKRVTRLAIGSQFGNLLASPAGSCLNRLVLFFAMTAAPTRQAAAGTRSDTLRPRICLRRSAVATVVR